MTEKKIAQFTMTDFILRNIEFAKTISTVEDARYDAGTLKGFHDMLVDVNMMDEKTFVEKYLAVIKQIAQQLEDPSADVDELSGYNNAVVKVLACIHPKYEYEEYN